MARTPVLRQFGEEPCFYCMTNSFHKGSFQDVAPRPWTLKEGSAHVLWASAEPREEPLPPEVNLVPVH